MLIEIIQTFVSFFRNEQICVPKGRKAIMKGDEELQRLPSNLSEFSVEKWNQVRENL